ncbi:MAG: magnesium chelatase family protein [Candidatus Peregrinibacteria bacterium Gr01-1014_25]|nr:MAG: magnesium chelatase family protein [Candidatus Peregrinibacteria bacterium Gr01-1014_25]
MFTQLTSFAPVGLKGERITVEVGSTPGESKFFIVGLGDTAVQESRQRVRLALRACGQRFPSSRVVTVNLAPADLKKAGPRYDLPIALGLLLAHELVEAKPEELKTMAFIGELGIDGSLRHVSGVLSAAIACRDAGLSTLVVPAVNGPEAALIPGLTIIAPRTLQELLDILAGRSQPEPVCPPACGASPDAPAIDFADVRGQELAKRALVIAAAGGHNALLSGAPGSGKTLLARALQGILPPLTHEESIEVTQIYSIANLLPADTPLLTQRPFRAVHHTASGVAIVGGGQIPGPGEVSLAHRGVLFLDELAEFPPHVLEVLRQPLEDRAITITRAQGAVTFPADVLLVTAMNPPQYTGSNEHRLRRRISAPLLDRLDLTVDVQPVPIGDLQQRAPVGVQESSELRQMVAHARERQVARLRGIGIRTNKEMGVRHLQELCPLTAECERLLVQAAERLKLSARSYHRTIKVARTIADLAGDAALAPPHIAEALQYRQNVLGDE